MHISSPSVEKILFYRLKNEPCDLVFILLKDGVPEEFAGDEFKIIFYNSNRNRLLELNEQLTISGRRFELTLEQQKKLVNEKTDFSLFLNDKTIATGQLIWGANGRDGIRDAPDIVLEFITADATWLVHLGYRVVDVNNLEQVEALAEEVRHAKAQAESAQTAAESASSAAQGFASSAQGSANAAGNSAAAAAGSAENAGAATDAAITARNQAETFAGSAGNSAIAAETSAGSAAGSATTAGNAASVANGSAAAAGSARTAAESAAEVALVHRNAAEAARSGAETAQMGAQTARTGAEAARDEVNATKDSFIRNSSDVFGAKVTAIVSLTQAEFDALPLKLNTTMYVISPDPAAVILQLVSLTQAEYDALAVKDDETAYLIEYAA